MNTDPEKRIAATVETIKGRHYLRGAPFASKQFLWERGAQWDAGEKAWWIEGKRKEADSDGQSGWS